MTCEQSHATILIQNADSNQKLAHWLIEKCLVANNRLQKFPLTTATAKMLFIEDCERLNNSIEY